jgi:hypothetical protein
MHKNYILFLSGILLISLAIQLSTNIIVENASFREGAWLGGTSGKKKKDTGGTTVFIILGCVAGIIILLYLMLLLYEKE